MKVYLDSDGNIIQSTPSVIGRGSTITDFEVEAPFSAAMISVRFGLRTGTTEPMILTRLPNASGKGYNVWYGKLKYAVTQYSGVVAYTIEIRDADGYVIASPQGTLTISKGNVPTLPDQPSESVWDDIRGYLNALVSEMDDMATGAYGSRRYNLLLADFEPGRISLETGENYDDGNTVYWRYKGSISTKLLASATVPTGYVLSLRYYNADGTYAYGHNLTHSNGTVVFKDAKQYDHARFFICKSTYQAFNLTQSDLDGFDIIVGSAGSDRVKLYNTLSELKSDDSLSEGEVCKTKGYYATEDGGGAEYIITKVKVNDVISVYTSSELYATLNCGHRINMLQVGVRQGDTDQTAKVQSIIDSLTSSEILSKTKFELFFPYGKYTFRGGIKLTGRHDLTGEMVTYGDKDKNINGTRFYFVDAPSDTVLIDATENYKCTISNIYVISNAVTITDDRSKISTGDADGPVDVFTVAYQHTGQVGIALPNYGSTLIDVAVRGVSYGVRAGTFNTLTRVYCWECVNAFHLVSDNVCSELRAFDVGTFITIGGAENIINNARCDSVQTYAVYIVGKANTITNLNCDYVQWMAVYMSGADDCYITGTISRCGTLLNNCTIKSDSNPNGTITFDDIHKTALIYMQNSSNNNRFDIDCSQRNPLDTESAYLVPYRAIITKGGNNYNDINLYGNRYGKYDPPKLLDLDQLYKLYFPLDSHDSAVVRYMGITYHFANVTTSYTLSDVYATLPTTLSDGGESKLATVNAAKIETLEANVADLMYEPIAIRSLQNAAGTVELGATVNSIIFTWALNKDPVSQTLEGVAISPSQRQHEFGGISLKSTKSYTLTATDERGAIASQSTTVYFYNGVYYGKLDADAALDSAAILSLTRKLQSGKSTTFTVNAGDAQKIAYALPTRYGTPAFNVGGFDGGFTKAATVNFTNSSGYTESYDIWLSDNVGLGNTTVKVS